MTAAITRATAVLLTLAATTLAADHQILGRRLVVRDSNGVEDRRAVIVQGKQSASSFNLVGNPTIAGASMQIVANGGNGSTQVVTLDAAGWTTTSDGFKYEGPTTGDPVRVVVIRRRSNGTSTVKAVLKGNVGAADLVVTPPNPGDDGGLVLGFTGGDRYCVSFGGAAGGSEPKDDAQKWVVVGPTATSSCPVSPCITTTTTSTTLPLCESAGAPTCGGTCPVGYSCEYPGSGPGCFCVSGGSIGPGGICVTCDSPCAGGDVCTRASGSDYPSGGQLLIACGCATPPVCESQCGGGCPAGSSCETPGGSPPVCACYL
jgi:hypothetical protein